MLVALQRTQAWSLSEELPGAPRTGAHGAHRAAPPPRPSARLLSVLPLCGFRGWCGGPQAFVTPLCQYRPCPALRTE